MKQLHGAAEGSVAAPVSECLALLCALERYPDWHPELVRAVSVLDGGANERTRAEVRLHVAHGPIVRDFDLLMELAVQAPSAVTLSRIPRTGDDREEFTVRWQLRQLDAARTELRLELNANLDVPRLLPLGGVGDAFAVGFVRAAVGALGGA